MVFDKKLIKFINDDVYYDGIDLGINRQMVLDYVLQTGGDSLEFIHFTLRKKLSDIRDKRISEIIKSDL